MLGLVFLFGNYFFVVGLFLAEAWRGIILFSRQGAKAQRGWDYFLAKARRRKGVGVRFFLLYLVIFL